MLGISIRNAWFLYNKGNPVQQIDFPRYIVTIYVSKYDTIGKSAARPSSVLSSTTAYRRDHLLTYISNKKRMRCAHEDGNSGVRTICLKCDLGLCIYSNVAFHRKLYF